MIHSEPKRSQHRRLNILQLREFYLTHCQLTPTFTYRFRHWGKKRKKTLKKRLKETSFSSSFLRLSSSPAPLLPTLLVSHYLSFSLPCTQLLVVAMGGMGGLGLFSTCLSSMPLAFLHCSFFLPAPLPQHGPPAGCSPSGVPAPMSASPAMSPQCPLRHVPTATFSNIPTQRCYTAPSPCLWHTVGP